MNLGAEFPDFQANTSDGEISFHDWKKDSWAILFSHPRDYTPVCTTELGTVSLMKEKFDKLGVKLIALSIDSVESHQGWVKDICAVNLKSWEKDTLAEKNCGELGFPIIADDKRELAVKFGMLDADEKDSTGMPVTARAVFVIGPDHKLKLSLLYPATTGRNFDEIYRAVVSLKLTAEQGVATPANWKIGDDCMVPPNLSDEDATARFSKGFKKVPVPSEKNYIRLTPQPVPMD